MCRLLAIVVHVIEAGAIHLEGEDARHMSIIVNKQEEWRARTEELGTTFLAGE